LTRHVPLISQQSKRTANIVPQGPLPTTVDEAVEQLRPERPLYVLWPERIEDTARRFRKAFPGETMFAVKTNPDKAVLRHLNRAGIHTFDVASIEEVRLLRRTLPKARLFFMHPVKSPEAIREAYFTHGIRHFVLDTEDELFKIMRETGLATDLTLFVRLSLPKNDAAAIDFSGKFGIAPKEAAALLAKCRPVARGLGICFHVGTQTIDPAVYTRAVGVAAKVIKNCGVKIDLLDIGGGFPVPYPGQEPPAIETFVAAITAATKEHGLDHIPLLAEPGRALVAESGSLVVRVELRKGDTLYINDGTYGGLFDAGCALHSRFPVRGIRPGGEFSKEFKEFRFAGPTCDSLDMMEGPFVLPADICMGDWIEIGNIGVYSQGMRTNFNGFGIADTISLSEHRIKA
jgi:ornithine decarboxylase